MDLQDILQIINENGLALTITGIVLYFAIRFGNLWYTEKKIKLERENELKLTTHNKVRWATLRSNPFFVNMNHWIYYNIPNTQFGDPGRDLMITDLLTILYKEFRDKLIDVVENESYNLLEHDEFQSKMVSIISKGMYNFRDKCKQEGIPEPLISMFHKYIEPTILYIKTTTEGICVSGYHQTNAEKVMGILNIYSAAFEVTLSYGEKALKQLNGELTGQQYKGLIAG